MIALPLVIIAALQLGASEEAQENSRLNLVDVATSSGLNFTLFVLFATTSFFLVVVYALFFGDTVAAEAQWGSLRSEEHTSELQSRQYLVCRLLLEKTQLRRR